MTSRLLRASDHWRRGTLGSAALRAMRRFMGLRAPSTLRTAVNAELRDLCQPITGTVLSVGEGHGADLEGGIYRDYFPHCQSYIRLEYDKGWGGRNEADILADVRSMPDVRDNAYDCVFCNQVLEHIDDVEAAVAELHRVIAPGGYFIFGVPLNYPYHGEFDYWRFSEDGLHHLLSPYFADIALRPCASVRVIELDDRLKFYRHRVAAGPQGYVGIATKRHSPTDGSRPAPSPGPLP